MWSVGARYAASQDLATFSNLPESPANRTSYDLPLCPECCFVAWAQLHRVSPDHERGAECPRKLSSGLG